MAKRTPVPAAIAARVQFDADRTCCVCRVLGKPIQIHHIDENPNNHAISNLAVLCRDCHDLTMMRGTFNRRLDADVVTLYRDDWVALVAERRAEGRELGEWHAGAAGGIDFANVVHKLEILKERKQYMFLAIEYERLGNVDLRDKYIDLALKNGVSDSGMLFLRSLQGHADRAPKDVVQRIIERQIKNEDWSQLARTYSDIGEYKNSIVNYCKTVIESLEDGNIFSAGYYLKELSEKKLFVPIFQQTYAQRDEEGDLWWALRSLQELEWWSEIRAFLLRNQKTIEKDGDGLLLKGTLCRYREYRSLPPVRVRGSRVNSGSRGWRTSFAD
jgi:hypothetical protein